jgi:hypothetical protein
VADPQPIANISGRWGLAIRFGQTEPRRDDLDDVVVTSVAGLAHRAPNIRCRRRAIEQASQTLIVLAD